MARIRVPTAQEAGLGQVPLRPLAGGNLSPAAPTAAFGGGQTAVIADTLGKAAGRWADAVMQVDQRQRILDDRVAGNDAFNAASQRAMTYFNDPDAGVYATRKGAGATGVAKDSASELEKIRTEARSSLANDAQRAQFDTYWNNRAPSWVDAASVYERRERDTYAQQSNAGIVATAGMDAETNYTDQNQVNAALKQGVTAIWESGQQTGEAPEMTRAKQQDFLNKTRERVGTKWTTTIDGLISSGRLDEADKLLKSGPMLTVDDALEQQESDGRPDAVSPKGAAGVRQIMPDTARYIAAKLNLPGFDGLSDEQIRQRLIADPDLSRQMGRSYFQEQMDRFGGNTALALAAYNAGPGKVQEWIEKYGDPTRGEISTQTFVSKIPFDETRNYVTTILDKATNKSLPVPADVQLKLQGKLDDARRQLQSQGMSLARTQLGTAADNQVALLSTGQIVSQPVTFEQVRSAYRSDDEAHIAWDDLQARFRTAGALGQVTGKSQQEQDAMLVEARPDPASPTYARDQQGYAALQAGIQADRKARADDPAGYVMRTDKNIQAVWTNVSSSDDPQAMKIAIGATMARQHELGIPADMQQPLPKDMARQLVDHWGKADSVDQAMSTLQGVTLNLNDPATAQKVLRQMEAAGLPAGLDRALMRMQDGDVTGARDIVTALKVKPGELPKLEDSKAQDVTAAVNAQFRSGGPAAVPAIAGAVTGQPGYQTQAARDRDLITRITTQKVAGGMDPETAAAAAVKSVYGDQQVVANQDFGAFTVPKGTRTSDVSGGLEAIRSGLDLSSLAPKREQFPAGGDGDGQFSIATRQMNAQADQWRRDGFWINHGNGYALVDPVTGRAFAGPDGKPRVWSLDEVLAARGQATAAAVTPPAAAAVMPF